MKNYAKAFEQYNVVPNAFMNIIFAIASDQKIGTICSHFENNEIKYKVAFLSQLGRNVIKSDF